MSRKGGGVGWAVEGGCCGDGVSFLTITEKTKSVDSKKNLLFFYDHSESLAEYLEMRKRLGISGEALIWHISKHQRAQNESTSFPISNRVWGGGSGVAFA
jgi:hypothetical protein